MFGPRLNTVFRSRWRALIWSACVLLTAYCTVQDGGPASGIIVPKAEAPARHVNPWSKNEASPQEGKADE